MIYIQAKNKEGYYDINDVMKIEDACFKKDKFSRQRYLSLLNNENAFVILVRNKDIVVGCGVCLLTRLRNNTFKGRIYSIAIIKEYRHRGIASSLLMLMEYWLRDRRVKYITLETHKSHKSVIRLYEKFGYIKTEDLPAYYDEALDGIRMRKMV